MPKQFLWKQRLLIVRRFRFRHPSLLSSFKTGIVQVAGALLMNMSDRTFFKEQNEPLKCRSYLAATRKVFCIRMRESCSRASSRVKSLSPDFLFHLNFPSAKHKNKILCTLNDSWIGKQWFPRGTALPWSYQPDKSGQIWDPLQPPVSCS